MTFLAPALLALAGAAAVPVLLHLLQRHQGPRVVFPALRYLRRAEREHATRIRLRQILLLAVRVLALLLLAAAAARPFLRGAGGDHPPTAVVIVLDNSMSSSAVVGDRRVLDALKAAALETVDGLGADDRVWLIRAGSPWEPAVTGTAETVADAVRRTEASASASALGAEVQRARSILASEADARGGEIHLLSDLQETALPSSLPDGGAAPEAAPFVVVYAAAGAPPPNRGVSDLEFAGGLPPRAGQRTTVSTLVTASDGSAGPGQADDSVAIRLVVDGSVRSAGWARPGAATLLPFPARPAGPTAGYVEIDADPLRGDDRRYFVTEVASPVGVAVAGPQPFLEEAVVVLENAGLVRRVPVAAARVVLAPAARSADAVQRGASVVVMPPATPLEIAATNQRLAAAGIPWRYAPPERGEARLAPGGSPLAAAMGDWLPDARLRVVYGLTGEGADTVALRLRDGTPWAVAGRAGDGGRFLLLGSPLTEEGGTLATSAVMVPFLDEVISRWAAGLAEDGARAVGAVVTVAGDSLHGPEGVLPVRPGSAVRLTTPGIHRVVAGGDTVAVYAVNPPGEESRLDRLEPGQVRDRLSGLDVTVAGADSWSGAIFRERVGQEITRWFVVAGLLLLGLEMVLSATGGTRPRHETRAGRVAAASSGGGGT